MSLVRLLRGAAVGLALLACDAAPEPVSQGCQYDNQCKEGRYCVNGQCVGEGSDNDLTGYSCERFCKEIVKCSSDFFGAGSDCVSKCYLGLEDTKQEFFGKGCVTTSCQDLVSSTYLNLMGCFVQDCKKGECFQVDPTSSNTPCSCKYQADFKDKTGINW